MTRAGFLWLLCLRSVSAFEVNWQTVDGGGVTWASGGGFMVGSTIGQPEPGRAAGGGFAVEGGFWPGALDEPGWTVPSLRIALDQGAPRVYWPADATNWMLQASLDLRSPAWGAVTNQPMLLGAEWSVSDDAAAGRLFRLERGP